MKIRTGLGQDSHRFLASDSQKACIIGGIFFEEVPGFVANSDGDVVLHAICNAITSVGGLKVLGGIADDLLKKNGIVDSKVYLKHALDSLGRQTVSHIAISIEAKRPNFGNRIEKMRETIANIMSLEISQVGITATSGEGLTAFGRGDGVQAFVIMTTCEE